MNNIDRIYTLRDYKLRSNGYSSYGEYLSSPEWGEIKQKIRGRFSRRWKFCNVCGSDKNLDIHHSSYKVIGLKNPGNTVKVLCRDCHQEIHNSSKEHPNWSLYKVCGKLRSFRKKAGLPIFEYKLK